MLSGGDPELSVLAADGLLPLPVDHLLALQLHLTSSPDPFLAERSRTSLRGAEPRLVQAFVEAAADEDGLRFFAHNEPDSRVLSAILRRRDVPRDLLVELAPALPAAAQEVLILRQDAIVDEPAILDALEENPALDSDVRRRIGEYRQHLVRARVEAVLGPGSEDSELTAEDFAAIEQVRGLPSDGEIDDHLGLSEGQIRALPVPVRIKLARRATKTLRSILVRDLNQLVAVAVLNGNPLSDDEIEQIASNRSVIEEVLVEIARRRQWIAKYRVALALAKNPKVPIAVAIKLVARLSVRDLKVLAADRNVQDPVRATAARLYKIKSR